jgi:hypothetical protein
MFVALARLLTAGHDRQRTDRSAAPPRRFVPEVTALEDRTALSAAAAAGALPTVPFKETLTVTRVDPTGTIHYEGHATHLGRVVAVLQPDNTFVKHAANGDTVTGFVTPATETTGTVTLTGGTGRFQGAAGLSSYVISTDPKTGATTVDITGTIASTGATGTAKGARGGDVQVLPFRVTGGGPAPAGLPLFPGGKAPHQATGTATYLGKYTGEGTFELGTLSVSATGEVTGTFQGSFVFVAANGDRLAMNYGAGFSGTFTGQVSADGTTVVNITFDAVFTPDPGASTGRFADVTGGGFRMIARAEPVSLISGVPGFTAPFNYTWAGEGSLRFSKGNK